MYPIVERDPAFLPYSNDIDMRMERYYAKKKSLLKEGESLKDFANAHRYFGLHQLEDGWVYREWAPAADGVYLTGEFNNWEWTSYPLKKIDEWNGIWEVVLPGNTIWQGCKVKTIVRNGEKLTEHLPIYTRRAVQKWGTAMWSTEAWDPKEAFPWTDQNFSCDEAPIIYESHVGMAQEEPRIATYREFARDVLPRLKKGGYNTVQLMAIMEHPYYGSFGYQVSSFFAPCSRYGKPEDLKYLINTAHEMGIRVLLDVVHSHAVKNTTDGLNLFDGTTRQFFHEGERGEHSAWGTKCFNYDKNEVIHFLLSNLKYWMDEFHFDGFRFDGVTSMLYLDHGLGTAFDSLDKYFSVNTDVEAITYLQLANELIHQINPKAITIAEDMSGMPGMCVPIQDGGIGFDYRLSMGVPDMWIKLIKETRDEDWNVEKIYDELSIRFAKTIGYAESHDQALVGDQTLMFRLAGANMYTDMDRSCHNLVIDRATALHKMIRFITIAAGGDGYLAFMGNEFGHPEWIDFPREGNNDSYHYCRRQWSLESNGFLKYELLGKFDKDMIESAKKYHIFSQSCPDRRVIHNDDQVVAFERGDALYVFNFSPNKSYEGYNIPVGKQVDYEVVMSTDDPAYGGNGLVSHMKHSSFGGAIKLYLPARTGIMLHACEPEKVEEKKEIKKKLQERKVVKKAQNN